MNASNAYELLSTVQSARYLGVSASFLAKARVYGKPAIPFTKIGASVRYRKCDLDAFVAANLRCSTSESDITA